MTLTRHSFYFLVLLFLSFLFGGCATLIGNVKPVDVKSTSYSVSDLSRLDPDWAPIQPSKEEASKASVFDAAYQSKKTGSVISTTSACSRLKEEDSGRTLRELSQELFLGISDIQSKTEKEFQIKGLPALQTTLEGKMEKTDIKIQTIVTRKNDCVYDLVLISKPQTFDREQRVFSRFVSSFMFK